MFNAHAKQYINRDEEPEIYTGSREDDFTSMIAHVLKSSGLKTKYTKILLSDAAMVQFGIAFTTATVDPNNNYEMYELLGDVAAGHFIKWYMIRRYPVLRCTKGVKVVARLLINYGSKKSFFELADKMGFWPFISATQDERDREKKSLLEDVFEAFLGVIEYLLDDVFYETPGVGYNAVYLVMKQQFDNMTISLRYEDLYDSKTRLKETFDRFGLSGPGNLPGLGILMYEEEERNEGDKLATSRVYRVVGGQRVRKNTVGGHRILMGMASAALKAEAQQRAAEIGIDFLKTCGYYKPPPQEYSIFDEARL